MPPYTDVRVWMLDAGAYVIRFALGMRCVRSKRIRIYFDVRRIKPAHINLCNKWCIQLALVFSVFGMLNG